MEGTNPTARVKGRGKALQRQPNLIVTGMLGNKYAIPAAKNRFAQHMRAHKVGKEKSRSDSSFLTTVM